MLITVIGRGHSGTRAISKTLSQSGVFMGEELNGSGDLVPPEEMYEACRVFSRYVEHLGGDAWDWSAAHAGPIDPAFTRHMDTYLASVMASDSPAKGWKIPETTLVLPWIVRLFPEARYIYWLRDPRDSLLGGHLTDDLEQFGVPHDRSDDIRQQRLTSWRYQYQIMRDTPSPGFRLDLRFEDLVLNQAETLAKLEGFLGIPMAAIPVRPESVGRWKESDEAIEAEAFPAEALYREGAAL